MHPLSDFNVDIAARVGNGEEGVLNDHLFWDVFQVYLRVLAVCHWFNKVIVDDVRRQVAGPFSGVRDEKVQVDLEVENADCWEAGVAIVGEFVAADCQANAVRLSFGDLDIADKVGIGDFFVFGDGVFGDREDGIVPFNTFGGVTGFTSTLCQVEKSFVVDISQVAFSGPDR